MNKTPAHQVADNVRGEAARKRISQRQLGEAIGLSQQSLSRRLLGRTAFDVNELSAIAEYLDIPVSTLISENSTAA
ncbi:MAG: helix-turn-helix transcriptional regulator [Rhodococcus sp. (in: high G+C Gram-positive bacteria)]|uniref:helix-turn-helix domain-containing protein n=1 Tax=Rhodococcus sp. TaxID=1831 RepID=UPI003BB0424C